MACISGENDMELIKNEFDPNKKMGKDDVFKQLKKGGLMNMLGQDKMQERIAFSNTMKELLPPATLNPQPMLYGSTNSPDIAEKERSASLGIQRTQSKKVKNTLISSLLGDTMYSRPQAQFLGG